MPEWLLRDLFVTELDTDAWELARRLALRLSAALALGCAVAGVYRLSARRPARQLMSFLATLVLLSVLIAMVTVVIGDSLARAFGLVGALAIVRFRTVVEDTRDTAFVIFAVIVGMGAGAGNLPVLLIGIPVVAVAALLFRPHAAPAAGRAEGTLVLRLGIGRRPEALLDEPFRKHLDRWRLTAAATVRQGAALDLTYDVCLRRPDAAVALVNELNGLEGVQGVELRT